MEVILKWCSKFVFIYQAALYLILTIQLPVFGDLKAFILLGYKVFTIFVVEPKRETLLKFPKLIFKMLIKVEIQKFELAGKLNLTCFHQKD